MHNLTVDVATDGNIQSGHVSLRGRDYIVERQTGNSVSASGYFGQDSIKMRYLNQIKHYGAESTIIWEMYVNTMAADAPDLCVPGYHNSTCVQIVNCTPTVDAVLCVRIGLCSPVK